MPSLVEIGPVALEKKILNFVNIFSLFLYYFPLEKGIGPSFKQTWIPFTKKYFVPIGWVVLEKKMKRWKFYANDNNDKDDKDGQQTNFDQKSSDTWALVQVS